jgi:hypothetical protein
MLKQLWLAPNCLHGILIAHSDLNPGNVLLAIKHFEARRYETFAHHVRTAASLLKSEELMVTGSLGSTAPLS